MFNWKYISITLLVVMIVFVLWYYKVLEPEQAKKKALGKARKQKQDPKQLPIDFTSADEPGKSKLIAVNDVIKLRNAQRELLRLARTTDQAKAQEYLALANEYHKEAQSQENYLNRNYSSLKGLFDDEDFSLDDIEMYFNQETEFFAINESVTIFELKEIIKSNNTRFYNDNDLGGEIIGMSMFNYFLIFTLQLNLETFTFEVTKIEYPNEKKIKKYWCR